MAYIDSFIMAVNTADLAAYKEQAEIASLVWREHGATEYAEYLGDDVPYGKLTSFPRAIEARDGQSIILGFAIYVDKATRDAVNEKVMADPRMNDVMQASRKFGVDFDRMIYGGFEKLA